MNRSMISLKALAAMVAAGSAAGDWIGQPSSGKRKLGGSYLMMGMLGVFFVGASIGISAYSNGADV